MILLVTYDLKGSAQSYGELFDILKAQENWWHYLASSWIVNTQYESARDLLTKLKPFLRRGEPPSSDRNYR